MRSAILFACLLLSACNVAPPPPAKDAPAIKPAANHELSDAIQKPIDRAKAANAPVEDADAAREKALQDAGG